LFFNFNEIALGLFSKSPMKIDPRVAGASRGLLVASGWADDSH